MLMVLLFTRMRQRLGRRIDLTSVLSCPTIAEQARALATSESDAATAVQQGSSQ
jgi:hypothetical protein